MASTDTDQRAVDVAFDGLRRVVRGRRDPRIRASWRVLIATILLVPPSEVAAVGIAGALRLAGPFPVGVIQASLIAIVLVGWARYLDRRPLADYGFSASGRWFLDFVVGFVAVLVGFGVWLGFGSLWGWAEIELTASAPSGAFAIGLLTLLIAVALNAGVQETVFTGLLIKNGAEGLAARGVSSALAVIGAWVVAALLFAWIHNPSAPAQVVTLVIGLALYGLLYVHTGELALPIGVHTGVNYTGGVLITSPALGGESASLVDVSDSLTGTLGSLSDSAVPQILIAYIMLLGWIKVRRGEVGIETGLAVWTEG